jgi:hypothetical protein
MKCEECSLTHSPLDIHYSLLDIGYFGRPDTVAAGRRTSENRTMGLFWITMKSDPLGQPITQGMLKAVPFPSH